MNTAPSFLEARPLAKVADEHVPLQNSQRLVCGSYHGSACQQCCFPNVVRKVLFGQGAEAQAFERVVAKVGYTPFHLAFVLWCSGPTRHNVHAVMPAEVGQLWIDLRIKPVGLEYRRLHIVEVDQQRTTSKMAQSVFQTAEERLGVLSEYGLAVSLTRIAQHHRPGGCREGSRHHWALAQAAS